MAIAGCPRPQRAGWLCRQRKGGPSSAEEGLTSNRGQMCAVAHGVGVRTYAGVRRWPARGGRLVKSPHGPGRLSPARIHQKSCEHPDRPLWRAAPRAALGQGMLVAPQQPPGFLGVADTPMAPQQSLGSALLTSSIRKGAEYSMIPIPCLLIPLVCAFPQKDRKPEG